MKFGLINVTSTDYKQRYIIDLIEVKRQRLRSIINNLFQSYIRYVILAYSKPPAVSDCYEALKELDIILEQIEYEITNNDSGDRIIKLLSKAKKIAGDIGGETQVIIEDLVESLYPFYNGQ